METIKDIVDNHWKKFAIAGTALLIIAVAARTLTSFQEAPPPTDPIPTPANPYDSSRKLNPTSETDPDLNKFDKRLSVVPDECIQFVEVKNEFLKGKATRMDLSDTDAPKIMQALEGNTAIYVVERQTQPGITYYCLQPAQ